MKTREPILKEYSISDLFNDSSNQTITYEVPIYQRNFAWEKDEITALIQDISDACQKDQESVYYIGTLVTFKKEDEVFEVIDGQQRLTTLTLIQRALDLPMKNKLTYRARRKATRTLRAIPAFDIDEKDEGIVNGFHFVVTAINELGSRSVIEDFKKYFQNNVHIIRYQVPRDIDLNHYFEIMNSRGEQLEKHEIVKANLLAVLNEAADRSRFNRIWESCSDMGIYVQQKYPNTKIFGEYLDRFILTNFDEIPVNDDEQQSSVSIESLLTSEAGVIEGIPSDDNQLDAFQPIIDFSNFLLIVLKLTLLRETPEFTPTDFNLDDKELLNEFGKLQLTPEFVKLFGYNLLKSKFLLDNYMVHHSKEEDRIENNPWKLQRWSRDKRRRGELKNLVPGQENLERQRELQHLLSMFEVSFTARQRKNYLFYCLVYLFELPSYSEGITYTTWYLRFVRALAKKYIRNVYLVKESLNEINTPLPGSFDTAILRNNTVSIDNLSDKGKEDFIDIYGDGTAKTPGIPLFVFNYLDYKIWALYAAKLRGEGAKRGSRERSEFFAELGCSDFDLNVFDQFYFSRTRRSLEHYYPQANANGMNDAPYEDQINCLGNFAMIGSEANSSGSNWSPKTKLDHYLDPSGKIQQVSVASLKFMIMMQRCKDNQDIREPGMEWTFEDIKEHQNRMLRILLK